MKNDIFKLLKIVVIAVVAFTCVFAGFFIFMLSGLYEKYPVLWKIIYALILILVAFVADIISKNKKPLSDEEDNDTTGDDLPEI